MQAKGRLRDTLHSFIPFKMMRTLRAVTLMAHASTVKPWAGMSPSLGVFLVRLLVSVGGDFTTSCWNVAVSFIKKDLLVPGGGISSTYNPSSWAGACLIAPIMDGGELSDSRRRSNDRFGLMRPDILVEQPQKICNGFIDFTLDSHRFFTLPAETFGSNSPIACRHLFSARLPIINHDKIKSHTGCSSCSLSACS